MESIAIVLTLTTLIGLYFAAAGIGLLVERDNVNAMFRQMIDQPMLGYLAGVVAFVIGGAILAVHNDWSNLLSGFITLIGWAALIEGVLMLAVRRWFLGLFARITFSPAAVTAIGAATTFAGVVLLWAGLTG